MAQTVSRVGLISDTHGHLDARVHQALAGVDAILHAGDVCGDAVLYELQTIAPLLVAVRGNCDHGGDAWGLEHVADVTIAGKRFVVVHELHTLAETPQDVDVIVYGHTHQPTTRRDGGVWYVNPGSASQRRRMPSRSVAVLHICDDGSVQPRIVMLDAIEDPGDA